ncbi:MAG: hypothetical protein HFJ06_03205 [Lachnospiraceae bacterium]|nr:hypothetical protein [Lachnospiraceae bacterium]
MAKEKEVQIKFSAQTAEFNDGIKKINSNISTLNAKLKLNDVQLKANSGDISLLKEKQQLLSEKLQDSREKINLTNEKLSAAKKIYGEDSEEVQKYTRQLLAAERQEVSVKNALEQCTAELNRQEANLKGSETAYSNLEKTIQSQESELTSLKTEYINITLEQGKNSEAAKELASEIGELSKALNKNKNKMGEAEKAAEDAAEGFGELKNGMEESGNSSETSAGGYTVVKDVIADLASNAVQTAIDKFKDLSVEAGAAIDKMQAKVGASKQDMENYKTVIQDVYKNGFGESMQEATEALGTVIQMTENLNDTELTKCTENVMTLSDVYGMDYTESLRAVNSLTDQFKISSDEAFNLIVQGAQNGLDQNGDLLDVINEYSVQFADSKLSANDMFNMIKNGADNGVWSIDKMGDAYKEFNIRMSDGTANEYLKALGLDADDVVQRFQNGGEDAKLAMNQVAQAIVQCDDKTLAYQTGVGIMGTMWEDMGQDACLALLNTEGQIDQTNSAMDSVKTDAYDNIKGDLASMNAAFDELGMSILEDAEKPLREMTQGITDSFVPALKDGISWMKEHKTLVAGIGIVIGSLTAGMAAYNIVAGIKAAMDAAQTTSVWGLVSAQIASNTAMLASPVTWVVAGIVALVAGIVLLWNKCEGFRKIVTALWNGMKAGFGAAMDGIKGAIEGAKEGIESFKGKMESAKEKCSETLGKIKEGAKEKLNGIKNIYEENGGGIKGLVAVQMAGQKELFEKGYNAINTLTGGKLDKLKDIAKEKMENAKGKFKDGIDKIKDIFDFKIKWPDIKMPSITVTYNTSGGLAKAARFLGLEGMPKFSVKWNAEGAILQRPTIFGFANGMLQGGGEAGKEAVIPIEKLEDQIGNKMAEFVGMIPTVDYDRLAAAMAKENAKQDIKIILDDRVLGRAVRRVM